MNVWPCTVNKVQCIRPCDDCPHAKKKHSLCKRCHGTGYISIRDGKDYTDCPACDGSGKAK